MTKLDNKVEQVTIQFKITLEEYAEIQRAKANSPNPRISNADFYREKLLKSITN